MINSVGINSINNVSNIKPLQFRGNVQTPSPQVQYKESTNLITQYLDGLAAMNAARIEKKQEISIPSEVAGFNNYVEIDKSGNELINVHYTKEGDAVVQNVRTKSIDGTTTERVVKNSDTEKFLNVEIKDKDGNVLMTRSKFSQKIDDDKSKSVVNGEVYNVSGLSGNVIQVEHNGETVTIDLEKMLNPDVVTARDENDNDVLRENKITQEEKEALFKKIKSMDGDDLFRLSKCTKSIQYFSGMDSYFKSSNKTLQLQIDKKWGLDINIHELGHGYNHRDETEDDVNSLVSSNDTIANIRKQAAKDYLANKGNKTSNDERFFGKFLDSAKYIDIYGNEAKANSVMQDEIFAESYNLLNTTDIVDFEDGVGCPGRVLSMMKYMPKALVEVNNLI